MTSEELARFEVLANDPARMQWERFCFRAQRCIANWCLANPSFEDLRGKPVEVAGCHTVLELFEPPKAKVKCPKCNGRGWVQPDESKFPSACECSR
jgi:hypothetical protein